MAGLGIIGGDYAGYECTKCRSSNTTFEEYGLSESDNSELGIICDDCEHIEPPDSFNQRFEEPDSKPDLPGMNKQAGDANNG